MRTTEKLDLRSHDIAEDKRRRNCCACSRKFAPKGGKIDFDRLKLALGRTVDVGKERYGMNWPGKADCFKTIQTPSLGTLRPVPGGKRQLRHDREPDHRGRQSRSAEAPAEVVSGQGQDDLHRPAVQHRQRLHLSRTTTANRLQTYLEYTGQVDAEGKQFGTNTETDGRFHSKWLNMMYPRFYLARNLLRETE